jgi:hypothetical protein
MASSTQNHSKHIIHDEINSNIIHDEINSNIIHDEINGKFKTYHLL